MTFLGPCEGPNAIALALYCCPALAFTRPESPQWIRNGWQKPRKSRCANYSFPPCRHHRRRQVCRGLLRHHLPYGLRINFLVAVQRTGLVRLRLGDVLHMMEIDRISGLVHRRPDLRPVLGIGRDPDRRDLPHPSPRCRQRLHLRDCLVRQFRTVAVCNSAAARTNRLFRYVVSGHTNCQAADGRRHFAIHAKLQWERPGFYRYLTLDSAT
jgi:hypothetical protein